MKLSNIIKTLRQLSPSFEGRIGGAAKFSAIKDAAFLKLPAAYVVPLDDKAEDNKSQTDYWQDVTEGFGVIVVLKPLDERGQHEAYDIVEDIKVEIWRALLGLEVSPAHHPIQYDGGDLLELDRGRIFCQFNFSAVREVGFEDTRQYFDLNPTENYNPLNIGKFNTLSGTLKDTDSSVTVNFEHNNIYEGNNDN